MREKGESGEVWCTTLRFANPRSEGTVAEECRKGGAGIREVASPHVGKSAGLSPPRSPTWTLVADDAEGERVANAAGGHVRRTGRRKKSGRQADLACALVRFAWTFSLTFMPPWARRPCARPCWRLRPPLLRAASFRRRPTRGRPRSRASPAARRALACRTGVGP